MFIQTNALPIRSPTTEPRIYGKLVVSTNTWTSCARMAISFFPIHIHTWKFASYMDAIQFLYVLLGLFSFYPLSLIVGSGTYTYFIFFRWCCCCYCCCLLLLLTAAAAFYNWLSQCEFRTHKPKMYH